MLFYLETRSNSLYAVLSIVAKKGTLSRIVFALHFEWKTFFFGEDALEAREVMKTQTLARKKSI